MSVTPLIVCTGMRIPPMTSLTAVLQLGTVQVVERYGEDLERQLTDLPAAPESIVVGLFDEQPSGDVSSRAFALIDAVRLCRAAGGRWPRRAVGLLAQSARPTAAALAGASGALLRYATVHLQDEEIAINLIVYRDTPVGRHHAVGAARALLSGTLDAVRGQTWVLTDE